ncbi:hypothetical protein CMQ_4116 [Grosmannia clavigera kw1407]|uniref:Pyrroloquinoline quinone-dependent pyranose dehydrogenase beta-propeller domain-containing protein n=1 Tax=Grosmannia clavigera (strain kw1407 / UAMH 11150) TaxID=655863 RepID=F0X8Q0_GROCL|nr:uncharacterized protein CMQ_4116 [Grosmannia clavigera kw1407]EFX06047.1 hypothetical protein CMQ_4116 [Grosmannia clavigera kw1407]
MKASQHNVAAALAIVGLGLHAAITSAASCSTVLTPSYNTPVVASGWTAQIVANGLHKPRSIQFDSSGSLLVVESGKGVSRIVFTDKGKTCLEVASYTTVVNDTSLNHGLVLTANETVLLASSVAAVNAYVYDAKTGSVSGSSQTVVSGMSNNDLTTRTLLMSTAKDGTLLVSRGSSEDYDEDALNVKSGLSQIRAFDLSSLTASSSDVSAYDFDTAGLRVGWGLRNSVGMAEHPVTGGIFAVENSIDDATREGTDIHENNPGEELNYLGTLSDLSSSKQGSNYGYPNCFAVWNTSIPDNAGLVVGSQVSMIVNSTYNDTTCADTTVSPRLTFPAHMAPLDIIFTSDGATAYVTFHGSTDKTAKVGYHLSSLEFNSTTGSPVDDDTSTTALTTILSNPDLTQCPGACFRPVGLAWDASGRLFMSSDATGEIYVLLKSSSTATSTASGTMVTPTSSAKSAAAPAALFSRTTALLAVALTGSATVLLSAF